MKLISPPLACAFLRTNAETQTSNPTMDDSFFKFPRTRHLVALSDNVDTERFGIKAPSRSCSDVVMTKDELAEFLAQSTPLVVEEKIDGANLGVSMADDFSLRFQNRSHFVNAGTAAQWSQLDTWAAQNSADLYTLLAPFTADDGVTVVRRVLFGEWMYARHSVAYNKLPAYFVAFDIAENGELLSVERRNELLRDTAIPVIARVAEPATYTLEQLLALLAETRSQYGDELIEGLYVKVDDPQTQRNVSRGKIVRADFIQQITTHWSKKTLVKNQIAW
jgi:hypothetical protein